MSRISDSRDPQGGIGFPILQHHRYDSHGWSLSERGCIIGVRVEDRDDDKGGLGAWQRPKGEENLGDLTNWVLWPKATRGISGFSQAWAAQVTVKGNATASGGANVCNVFLAGMERVSPTHEEQDNTGGMVFTGSIGGLMGIPLDTSSTMVADARYQKMEYVRPKKNGKELWPKFPKGWHGIVVAGANEDEQVSYFMPCEPRLVAVHRKGDPAMGTLICDMGEDFEVDATRMERLQSHVRIVKLPTGIVNFFGRNSIAWSIAPAG